MTLSGLRSGRGALVTLALLLASSGALRLGLGVGQALARAPESLTASDSAPLDCPPPPMAVVDALTARETRLATRESALADRLAALDLAETAIRARIEEMSAAEAELKATIQIADGAAEQDLISLTAVYEAMKPTDTARLFATMAPDFAAGFLGRMRPEAAAAVLSGMTPETAYAISVLIAGRNALAPTQ